MDRKFVWSVLPPVLVYSGSYHVLRHPTDPIIPIKHEDRRINHETAGISLLTENQTISGRDWFQNCDCHFPAVTHIKQLIYSPDKDNKNKEKGPSSFYLAFIWKSAGAATWSFLCFYTPNQRRVIVSLSPLSNTWGFQAELSAAGPLT